MEKWDRHPQNDFFFVLCGRKQVMQVCSDMSKLWQIGRTILSLTVTCVILSPVLWIKKKRWLNKTLIMVFEHGITCLITIMAYRGGHNWKSWSARFPDCCLNQCGYETLPPWHRSMDLCFFSVESKGCHCYTESCLCDDNSPASSRLIKIAWKTLQEAIIIRSPVHVCWWWLQLENNIVLRCLPLPVGCE